jgi:hypothetical protein
MIRFPPERTRRTAERIPGAPDFFRGGPDCGAKLDPQIRMKRKNHKRTFGLSARRKEGFSDALKHLFHPASFSGAPTVPLVFS